MAERSGGSDRLLVEGAAADQPVSALEVSCQGSVN